MSLKKIETERTYECHRCWVPMKKKEIDVTGPNIIIDVCPTCQGVWLDKGELGKVLKDRNLTTYLTKHIGTKSRSPMVCPKCGMTMDIETADNIQIDVCLFCNGVWLDQWELDQLKEKSKTGFQGDQDLKNEELMEEWLYKAQNSSLQRFLRKITR